MSDKKKVVLPQSTLFGSFLMLIAVAPPVLWVGDVTGLLPLTTDGPWWVYFSWPLFFGGVGWVFIAGEGETIGQAATAFFKGRFGGK